MKDVSLKLKNPFVINLVVGDWSGDGHSMTSNVMIHSNLSINQIKKAVEVACTKVGFDFTQEICQDYECTRLSDYQAEKLMSAGIDLHKILEFDEELNEWSFCYDPHKFVELWLEFVKLGNSKFIYEIVEGKNINIGGYGLFLSLKQE